MQNNNLTQDLVTIVTVTYNAEDLLEETILSVINQSYDNIEYIIIDGSSTDSTIDIIKKYEDKIDYWVSEPDDGIYFAMNKAIEKATGKWINFMNADDTFFDHNTILKVMEQQTESTELIYGNFKKKNANIVVKAENQENWYRTMPFNHQTLFTKTDIMKENLFDTNYKIVADLNFILTMYQENRKFQYCDQTLAIFTEGGFANSNTIKMCLESTKVLIEKKVALKDIYATSWYRYLYSTEQSYHILQDKYHIDIESKNKSITKLTNKNDLLIKTISELHIISTLKHPIRKIQAYKKLMSIYQQY